MLILCVCLASDARVKTLESQVTDLETRLSTTTSNHVQETGKQMESKHCQTMEEPTNKDEKKVQQCTANMYITLAHSHAKR